MRHINFFQIGGFWVGAEKFMLKKFMCFFRPLKIVTVRKPENAKERGKKEGGSGAKPHEENFHGKQFPTPPRYVPPPHAVCLTTSFRDPQNFPQVAPSGTAVGGSPKAVSRGHPREVCPSVRFSPF